MAVYGRTMGQCDRLWQSMIEPWQRTVEPRQSMVELAWLIEDLEAFQLSTEER